MPLSAEHRRQIDENLAAWEQVAPIHRKHNHAALLEAFRKPGHSVLDRVETARLMALGIQGKDVAQICCNNGRELISVKNLGARRCVGFDGAQGFIDQARELAAAAGQDVEFICTDVHAIDPRFENSFDLATITIGVLSWMPSLPDFFGRVARLLRPGGALFVYEQHPIVEMFYPGGPEDPVDWELSYFNKEPYVSLDGLDYYGGERYDAKAATSYMHTMAEIIMAGVTNGLAVEHFEEHPHHISNAWFNVEAAEIGVPMCFTLTLRKPDAPRP